MKLNGVEIGDSGDLAPAQEKEPWWGPPAFVSYADETGNLVVNVTKRRRKGELALAIALAFAGAVCFVFPEARGGGFGLLFAGAVFLYQARHITGTTMTVSPEGLFSQFSGRLLKKREQVLWEKAGRLSYLTQTKNRPQGLYAKRGMFSYTCLIPYINSAQTKDIIAKIYERFPQQQPIA